MIWTPGSDITGSPWFCLAFRLSWESVWNQLVPFLWKPPWPPRLKHLVPSHNNPDFGLQSDRHRWGCWTACLCHYTLSSKKMRPPQPSSVTHTNSLNYVSILNSLNKRTGKCGRLETGAQVHPTPQLPKARQDQQSPPLRGKTMLPLNGNPLNIRQKQNWLLQKPSMLRNVHLQTTAPAIYAVPYAWNSTSSHLLFTPRSQSLPPDNLPRPFRTDAVLRPSHGPRRWGPWSLLIAAACHERRLWTCCVPLALQGWHRSVTNISMWVKTPESKPMSISESVFHLHTLVPLKGLCPLDHKHIKEHARHWGKLTTCPTQQPTATRSCRHLH